MSTVASRRAAADFYLKPFGGHTGLVHDWVAKDEESEFADEIDQDIKDLAEAFAEFAACEARSIE